MNSKSSKHDKEEAYHYPDKFLYYSTDLNNYNLDSYFYIKTNKTKHRNHNGLCSQLTTTHDKFFSIHGDSR